MNAHTKMIISPFFKSSERKIGHVKFIFDPWAKMSMIGRIIINTSLHRVIGVNISKTCVIFMI